jgi:hypothetical protein
MNIRLVEDWLKKKIRPMYTFIIYLHNFMYHKYMYVRYVRMQLTHMYSCELLHSVA